jgi:hypothetical protein
MIVKAIGSFLLYITIIMHITIVSRTLNISCIKFKIMTRRSLKITLLIQLYARVAFYSVTRGKHLHDSIISLLVEVWGYYFNAPLFCFSFINGTDRLN